MVQEVQLLLNDSAIKAFRLRGVTTDILTHRIASIRRIFGNDFVEKQLSKPIEDMSKAGLICERGALISELSAIPGISNVAREIKAHRDPSLLQPEGQWFQLLLGGTLNRLGSDIAFEQTIGESAPKDILIQNRKCHVECKAFLRSTALEMIWRHHIDVFNRVKNVLPKLLSVLIN